jgi:hypothetical protein
VLRVNQTSACAACAAGTWNENAVNDTTCDLCDAGFVCPLGSDNPRALVCPAGGYCPPGSASNIPCLPGAYSAQTGLSADACIPCPTGTFADQKGSPGCAPCAGSSQSEEGATFCTCIGQHRVFQASDSMCICQTGYTYLDRGEEDGPDDCQARVYVRCADDSDHDVNGNCVSKTGGDCDAKCGIQGGTYSISMGMCQCKSAGALEEICDQSCRDSALKVVYQNGQLCSVDPATGSEKCTSVNGLAGFDASLSCAGSCKVTSVTVNGGLAGLYGVPPVLKKVNILAEDLVSNAGRRLLGKRELTRTPSSPRMDRIDTLWAGPTEHLGIYQSLSEQRATWEVHGPRLRKLLANEAASIAINPAVICVNVKDIVLFDLSSTQSYPVYLRDNLLNTNVDFDYGPFRALATRNLTASSMFAYSFPTDGIYAFADSADLDKQSIFKVTKEGEQCPDAQIMPLSFASLVQMGVRKSRKLMLSPNWLLVGVMIALVLAFFALPLGGLYYFQKSAWSTTKPGVANYKKVALKESEDIWSFNTKGSILNTESVSNGVKPMSDLMGTAAKTGEQFAVVAKTTKANADADVADKDAPGAHMHELSARFDWESFDFHSLYKMIEANKTDFELHHNQQAKSLQSFYERITSDTDQLKQTLSVKMYVQLNKSGEGFEEAVKRLVLGEIASRRGFESQCMRHGAILEQLLDELAVRMDAIGNPNHPNHPNHPNYPNYPNHPNHPNRRGLQCPTDQGLGASVGNNPNNPNRPNSPSNPNIPNHPNHPNRSSISDRGSTA